MEEELERSESVLSSPSATKIILWEATIGWCNNLHVGLSLHNSNKQLARVRMPWTSSVLLEQLLFYGLWVG
jgi:hypothetical protein